MRLFRALVALAAIASPTLAATPFTAGKISISTLDGSSRLSESFSPRSATPVEALTNVRLDSDELIRVSFNVGSSTGDDEATTAAPTQLAIQLQSTTDPSRIFSWNVTPVKTTGKVSWSQRVDRLPTHRLSTQDHTYALRLLVAGKEQNALALQLGSLVIPYLRGVGATTPTSSQRYRLEEELGFHRWEEKRHTFRKEITEGMPGAKKSMVVAVILVVIPWLVLSGLLLPLVTSSSLQLTTPKLPTSILFASLLFLEVIGLRYYKGDFVLFKMLPLFIAGAAVASVAILAGGVRGGVGLVGGK